MEYPYITTQGNSYEYGEILRWLKDNNTDPKSGVLLTSKQIFPNNILRSQIIEWFESKQQHRKPVALIPPTSGNDSPEENAQLKKILSYTGSKIVGKKNETKVKLLSPQSFPEYAKTYFFSKETGSNDVQVSCDGGESITLQDTSMFLTNQGVIFFDPTEIRDTKVIPGSDNEKMPCKFRNGCKNENCQKSHYFVCKLGITCPSLDSGAYCKFNHPDGSSVIPLGDTYPLNQVCRYGTECSGKKCGY